MGSAFWGRSGTNHETRILAGESHGAVLRQRHSSPGGFALGSAVANCVPVSQVDQTAAEDDAGAKVETDATAAAAEVNGSDIGQSSTDIRRNGHKGGPKPVGSM